MSIQSYSFDRTAISTYGTFKAWAEAMSTATVGVRIMEDVAIDEDLDMSEVAPNVTIGFGLASGSFTVASGKTLTINRMDPGAPLRQLFAGAGAVRYGRKITDIDVRHFGAVCDGATNDTTAVQAAINALPEVGSDYGWARLIIPGSCVISTSLTINSKTNFEVVGVSGRAGQLKAHASLTGGLLILNDCSYFRVRGIGFYGLNAGGVVGAAHGIVFQTESAGDGTRWGSVEQCSFDYCAYGLWFRRCYVIDVDRCFFGENNKSIYGGKQGGDGSDTAPAHIGIRNCVWGNNTFDTGACIDMYEFYDSYIGPNNHFETLSPTNKKRSIFIQTKCQRIRIHNNAFFTSGGIRIDKSDTICVDNQFEQCEPYIDYPTDQAVIDCRESGAHISGNIIRGYEIGDLSGILITASARVVGNQIKDYLNGIKNNGADGSIITNNTIDDCTVGIYDNSTGSIIQDNAIFSGVTTAFSLVNHNSVINGYLKRVTANGSNLTPTEIDCTFTDTGDYVNDTAHGLTEGMQIAFTSITDTTGISTNTRYFVKYVDVDKFQVALTYGGLAVTLTTDGSGKYVAETAITTFTLPRYFHKEYLRFIFRASGNCIHGGGSGLTGLNVLSLWIIGSSGTSGPLELMATNNAADWSWSIETDMRATEAGDEIEYSVKRRCSVLNVLGWANYNGTGGGKVALSAGSAQIIIKALCTDKADYISSNTPTMEVG